MAIKYKWLIEQLREIISDSIQKGINKLPTEQELAVRYRAVSYTHLDVYKRQNWDRKNKIAIN